jgi:hypothetical protein
MLNLLIHKCGSLIALGRSLLIINRYITINIRGSLIALRYAIVLVRYLLWIQSTNDRASIIVDQNKSDRVRVACKLNLTLLVRSFRIKGTDQKRTVMSKAYYLATIASFCNMDNAASEEEITRYIKKLGGIDIEITEKDVVLWASDVKTEVPLGLIPEMSSDKVGGRLVWGFNLIQNFREWSTLFSMEGGEVLYRIRGDHTVEMLYPSCTDLSEETIVSLIRENINDRLQLHKVSDGEYEIQKLSERENTIIFPITGK